MRKLIQLITAVLATITAALGVGLTAAPADAADPPFDLLGLASPGLHITTGSCRHVPVTAKTTAPYWVDDIDATVDVWKGTKQVDSIYLTPVNGNPQTLAGDYYFCPALDDPGTYRLGDTEVEYWDTNYDSNVFIDTSPGTLVAKQAVRADMSATRSGATRVFYVHAQYFSGTYDPGWYNYPRDYKILLQRRPATGTGSWSWVATRRIGDRGRTTFKITAGRTYQYRVVAAGTNWSWNLVGPVMTK